MGDRRFTIPVDYPNINFVCTPRRAADKRNVSGRVRHRFAYDSVKEVTVEETVCGRRDDGVAASQTMSRRQWRGSRRCTQRFRIFFLFFFSFCYYYYYYFQSLDVSRLFRPVELYTISLLYRYTTATSTVACVFRFIIIFISHLLFYFRVCSVQIYIYIYIYYYRDIIIKYINIGIGVIESILG